MFVAMAATAGTHTQTILIANSSADKKADAPVTVLLDALPFAPTQSVVTIAGREIPSQLNDLDGDGKADELCFLVDIDKKQKLTAEVTYSDTEKQKDYPARTFASLMIRNSKVKISNKHDLYVKELIVPASLNFYSHVHQHGSVLESELTAFRIYFDNRQTLDLYGKYQKRLELKETQFYPDEQQKAAGYGDDVLWAGNTLGAGALRGFDGKNPVMLDNLDFRGQRVIADGPVCAIVEVIDQNWIPAPGQEKVTMKTYYRLYAGHRDCQVTATFDKATANTYCAGIINVAGSKHFNDHKGLRACWGSNWTVAAKDTIGKQKEIIGLAISVPRKYIKEELPSEAENLAYALTTKTTTLSYHVAFASGKETFGFRNQDEWFDWLKAWKRDIASPLEITVR